MNIYELSFGIIRKFIVAKDEQEAYNIGTNADLHPDIHFRPFEIVPIEVEGYTVTVTPNESQNFDTMSRDELKDWLKEHDIEFTPQWGEQKLRELALQHV
jgi:hypothetical protein